MPNGEPNALQELLRRRAAAGRPVTPLGGTAALGGPSRTIEEAMRRRQAGGLVAPGQVPLPAEAGGAGQLALEIGGAIAGAMVGGAGAVRAVRPGSRLVAKGMELLGRTTGAGAGSVAGSEIAAPTGEVEQEALRRRVRAAAEGAAGEVIAPAVKAATGLVARPIRRRMFGETDELLEAGALEAQELIRASGGTLTPGQAKVGFLFDTMENIAEASFIGGGLIQRTRARGAQAAIRALDRASPRVAQVLSPEDAGLLLQKAVQNSAETQRALTRGAYKALDDKIVQSGGSPTVNLQPVIDDAQDTLEVLIRAKDPDAARVMSILGAFGGEPVTFRQADKIRSQLLGLSRKDSQLIPGVKLLAGRAAGEVDKEIQKAGLRLGEVGREVLDAFNVARSTARIAKETFNDDLVGNLMSKASPEDLARGLFVADSPTRTRAVREIIFNPRYRQAVGDPERVWREVQATFLSTLRTKAHEGSFTELSGRALLREVDKSGGTFTELFPNPLQRSSLRTAARALELAQSKASVSGSGRIFIQLAQAGAAVRGAQYVLGIGPAQPGSEEAGTAGVILLGPGAIALALTRPTVASLLLKEAATRIPRSGAALGAVLAQLIARLRDERVPFTFLGKDGQATEFTPDRPSASAPRFQSSRQPMRLGEALRQKIEANKGITP